jgi:hypothetical protein
MNSPLLLTFLLCLRRIHTSVQATQILQYDSGINPSPGTGEKLGRRRRGGGGRGRGGRGGGGDGGEQDEKAG